jgi:hypothetical protein|tara:strand:+ start:499 stop:1350 length:852 start_codon:yes stop_codon:yes gene_type:complete
MIHPAELSVHAYLRSAINGEASMSEDIIQQVATDVAAALNKQFNGGPRDEFRLRMSNIGRPRCQLWFAKNYPETDVQKPTSFMLNMLMGDWTEAMFKGVLRAAGVDFGDNAKVTLKVGDAAINGEYDMVLDGKVDDVKSTTPYGYDNKFASYDSLAYSDDFGYVSQLIGYAVAADKDVGGWWVVNKVNGQFKYVSAETANVEEVMESIKGTIDYINNDEPFERCFEAEPETFRKKASGNMKLCKTCSWCDHKKKCWPELKQLPSKVYSGSKLPPLIEYTYVEG